MNQKVIEPSEIFTGREEPFRKEAVKHIPVMRLIARFFDYGVFFAFLHLPIFEKALPIFNHWVPIEFLAWAPIEMILLATWGTTLGKRLLNIQLQKGRSLRLPLFSAARRSAFVWIRGMGLGIFGLNFFCMMNAYYRLMATGATSWDRDEGIAVLHRAVPKWRFYLTTAVTCAVMIYYLVSKSHAV